MGYPAYYSRSGQAPVRAGASHASIAPYGPFQSGDGKAVYLGVQNEREWERFCRVVLRRSELATDARFDSSANRVAHRGELHDAIDEVFGHLDAVEIVERLEPRRLPTPA